MQLRKDRSDERIEAKRYRRSSKSDLDACGCPLRGYDFSPQHNAKGSYNYVHRIGVPGHPSYPQNWRILLYWDASSFQLVFGNSLFWIYMVFLSICIAIFANVDYTPELKAARIPAQFQSIVNTLCIFILTFLLGQCMSEDKARFECVCKTNGCVTRLSALAAAHFPPDRARLLMRYTNAIMHIYYLMLSGPLDESKWKLLRQRGLLTEEEIEALQLQGSPGVVLYTWAVKGFLLESYSQAGTADRTHPSMPERMFVELISNIEQQIGGTRGLAAKQIAYTQHQIPSTYFHIVYVAVNAFLLFSVYDTGHRIAEALSGPCEDAQGDTCVPSLVVAVVTEFIILVIFLGLLFTAELMSDTFGNGIIDYDLGNDLDNLWQESQNVLKSMNVHCPSLPIAEPPKPTPPLWRGGQEQEAGMLARSTGSNLVLGAGSIEAI